MTEPKHALLAASGAERWLHCTPSARLEETLPDNTSDYAKEGTLAHSIAELKLRKKFLEPMGTRTFNSKMKVFKENPLYNEEMESCTDEYIDYITGVAMSYPSKPYVTAEKRVNYSRYAPEGFGTSDCIVIGGNTMHVIDYKHGKGVPVSAEDNPQMMLYALGAIEDYRIIYDIKNIVMTIVQPRLNNISEFTITAEQLLNWGVFTVKPKAQEAFAGKGDFNPFDQGKYPDGHDWCKFCRAKATCEARKTLCISTFDKFNGMKPPLISNEEVGEILKRTSVIKAWAEDLEAYALAEIIKGNSILGWKAVEGRSNRQFGNIDTAFSILNQSGYEDTVLYERKPLTLTAVEKLVGKKTFEELLNGYIEKPAGKPTLAPESDKREPISLVQSAKEVFSKNENGGNENE